MGVCERSTSDMMARSFEALTYFMIMSRRLFWGIREIMKSQRIFQRTFKSIRTVAYRSSTSNPIRSASPPRLPLPLKLSTEKQKTKSRRARRLTGSFERSRHSFGGKKDFFATRRERDDEKHFMKLSTRLPLTVDFTCIRNFHHN
jgi:hypothetical protein